ncbi:right-handed parallel beta-helix repeat-containing protein [Halosimplex amylolyticum]|uniref:right-handed parallel beta-helix repeat-containing protein n=1 Tax=Halosimplex amylolyticum TaxID=3396616 RepID=UPI003F55E979
MSEGRADRPRIRAGLGSVATVAVAVALALSPVTPVLGSAVTSGPLAGSALASTGQSGATAVDGCTTISSAGTYALTADVQTNATGDCIRITASGVVLDGANHTLSGPWDHGDPYSAGVNVTARNVTVTDLRATDFARGVTATGEANGLVVERLTVENAWFGVLLGRSDGLDDGVVTGSHMDGVRVGVRISAFGANNTVSNSSVGFSHQRDVLLLAGATDNEIRGNDVTEIFLEGASANRIVDNDVAQVRFVGADDNVVAGNDVGPSGIDIRRGGDANTIRNNVVLGGVDAIHVRDSSGTRIVENTVLNASDWGIQINDAPNTVVRSNRVRGHLIGISVTGTGPVRVRDNTVTNNSDAGIRVGSAADVSVVGNDVRNVSDPYGPGSRPANSGVEVGYSESVVVRDNDVSTVRNGVVVWRSADTHVAGNRVTNASFHAVWVDDATNVTVADNELRRNMAGVHGSDSTALRFVNNTVANRSNYGTTVYHSRDVTIRDSRIVGNKYVGLRLRNVTDARLDGVVVRGHWRLGIRMGTLTNVTLRNVESTDNGNGIRARRAENLTIADTVATGNVGYGILVRRADAPTLRGNEARLNNYGLRLANATNASVSDTLADANANAGVLVRSTDGARLTNVTATDNDGAGVRLRRANRTTVSRATVDDNYWGVRVTGGRDSAVHDVSASRNRYTGVRLFEATNTTVDGAEAAENNFGVKVVASAAPTVRNLTANRNDKAGMRVDDETWNGRGDARVSALRLRNVTARDNRRTGIRVDATTGLDVQTAAVSANNKGIWVSNSDVVGLDELTLGDQTGYPLMVVNGTSVEHAANLTLADGTTLDVSGRDFKVRTLGPQYRPAEPDGYGNVSTWAVVEQTDPEASAVVAMDYTDAAVDEAGVDESTLRLWHYDSRAEEWTKYDGNNSVDTMTNTVSASIDAFGTVVPLGELTNTSTASLTVAAPAKGPAAAGAGVDLTVAPPPAVGAVTSGTMVAEAVAAGEVPG